MTDAGLHTNCTICNSFARDSSDMTEKGTRGRVKIYYR